MIRRTSLEDVTLPETGNANFWDGETQYTVQMDRPDYWSLYRIVGNRARPLATIHRHPEYFDVFQDNGDRSSREENAREALRWGMRNGG